MNKVIVEDAHIYNAQRNSPRKMAPAAALDALQKGCKFMEINGFVVYATKKLSSRTDFVNAIAFIPLKTYYGIHLPSDGWQEPLHYVGSNPALKPR
ncbi:MAG TPA: hypothetical protein VIF12_01940 [Micavibrio sp.]|jgi:hypothetical protein